MAYRSYAQSQSDEVPSGLRYDLEQHDIPADQQEGLLVVAWHLAEAVRREAGSRARADQDQQRHVAELAGQVGDLAAVRAGVEEAAHRLDGLAGTIATLDGEVRQLVEQARSEFRAEVDRLRVAMRAESRIRAASEQLRDGFQGEQRLRAWAERLVFEPAAVSAAGPDEVLFRFPDYWLAPAAVAYAAWRAGDQDRAARAVAAALAVDGRSAALYLGLLVGRAGRVEAAARWIEHYLRLQEPERLPPAAIGVLDAAVRGDIAGPDRGTLLRVLRTWREDPQVLGTEQQLTWCGHWLRERADAGATGPDLPAEVAPEDARRLAALAASTTAYGRAQDALSTLLAEIGHPAPAGTRVEDVLHRLVCELSPAEAELRARIRVDAAIRDLEDDTAAPDPSEVDGGTDVAEYLTSAVVAPGRHPMSAPMRRLAVTLTADRLTEAVSRAERGHRDELRPAVPIRIGDWDTDADLTAADLGRARLSSTLDEHITAAMERELARLRFTGPPLYASIGAGIAAVLAVVVFIAGSVPGGIALTVLAAAGGLWAWLRTRSLPSRRANARRRAEDRRRADTARLATVLSTLDTWRSTVDGRLAAAADLRAYLGRLDDDPPVPADPPEPARGLPDWDLLPA
jgi:hypothetical protein